MCWFTLIPAMGFGIVDGIHWCFASPPGSGNPELSLPSSYRTSAAKMWSFGAAQGMNDRQQQAGAGADLNSWGFHRPN